MAAHVFEQLNRLVGSAVSGSSLADLSTSKRQALRDSFLMPDALDLEAVHSSEELQDINVVVVGGGFAGLSAAWYLNRCGVLVAVFEASERLGGRVRTDRDFVANRTVEAGAELIGANHPMWNDLADTFGLQLIEVSESDPRIRIGDHDLTDHEKKQVYDELLDVIDVIGQDAKDIDPVHPWLSPDAAAFDAMTVAERLDELLGAAGSLTRSVIDFQLGNDNCAPPSQQSYLGLLALVSAGRVDDCDETTSLRGYWDYTETFRCSGGNDQLAAMLVGDIDADNMTLNDPVTDIAVREDRVDFTTTSGTGTCDYLVLAVPPTAWPSITSHLEWNPAERTMTHGPAVKYLNSFVTAFWDDSGLTPNALVDGIGSVWEGTDSQPVAPDAEFALSVYSGGTFIRDRSSYPTQLASIFPGYAPVDERFVDWPNTPGVLTGYSVPAPGEVTTVGQALAEPHGRMYLAGEQTWMPFFGYMEGALQSGARAAREIIRLECPEAMP